MFRVTCHVLKTRSFLSETITKRPYDGCGQYLDMKKVLRRPPLEIRILKCANLGPNPCKPPVKVRIKLKSEPARDPCPARPPPPPKPPKDDKWIWLTLTAMILTGTFAVYAKQNPEVRDWITIVAPWFDDFIAVLYQENMNYQDFVNLCIADMKRQLQLYLYPPPKPEECLLEGETNPPPPPPETPAPKKIGDCEVEEDQEPSPCDTLPSPFSSKDICDVEACIRDLGETIVNNYTTAVDACRYYNSLIDEVMNRQYCTKTAQTLESEMKDRICLVKNSLTAAAAAEKALDNVSHLLDCGCQIPKEEIEKTKKMLGAFRDKINMKRTELAWENDRALAEDEHFQLVNALMNKYMSEMISAFPGLNYFHRRPSVPNIDMDLLILHTKRYRDKLQAELEEAREALSLRVDRAMKNLNMPAEKKNKDVEAAFAKKKADYMKEYDSRTADLRKTREKELQDALKALKDKSDAELEEKCAAAEKKTMANLEKLVKQKVDEEKANFAMQLAEMQSKLSAVEYILEERMRADRESKRSRALYAAGFALMNATRKGDDRVDVQKELKAIEANSGAKEGDQLVTKVLAAIPESVYVRGVVPESVLKSRYYEMEDVARKVALVENDGGPLPIYLLSYLQSLLLFLRPSDIPIAEKENPPDEPPEELDTFDLLQRASYYVETGKLSKALQYVEKMEGASRGAAESWHSDARAFLETRQAAAALMAHATALASRYV